MEGLGCGLGLAWPWVLGWSLSPVQAIVKSKSAPLIVTKYTGASCDESFLDLLLLRRSGSEPPLASCGRLKAGAKAYIFAAAAAAALIRLL